MVVCWCHKTQDILAVGPGALGGNACREQARKRVESAVFTVVGFRQIMVKRKPKFPENERTQIWNTLSPNERCNEMNPMCRVEKGR